MKKSKILLAVVGVILVAALPSIVIAALWWPGAAGVAFIGLLGAALAFVKGGARLASAAVVALGLFTIVVIPGSQEPVAGAATLILIALGYAATAVYGRSGVAAPVAILVPFFMMTPIPIFSTAPAIVDGGYLAATGALIIGSGLWAIFLLSRVKPDFKPKPGATVSEGRALVFGLVVGITAATVAYVAATHFGETHWAWVTLTLYILVKPTISMDWIHFRDRILGTAAGLAITVVVLQITTNQLAIYLVALVCGIAALATQLNGSPYWLYVIPLTPAVVLMLSQPTTSDTLVVARMEFTLIGAALAVLVAAICTVILREANQVSKKSAAKQNH